MSSSDSESSAQSEYDRLTLIKGLAKAEAMHRVELDKQLEKIESLENEHTKTQIRLVKTLAVVFCLAVELCVRSSVPRENDKNLSPLLV